VIVREGKAESDPEALVARLSESGVELQRVGLEAGPLSPWLYDSLRAAGLPAVCIETRRMKGATAVMAVKTDLDDARAIAQAIRVGWYTAVRDLGMRQHLPSRIASSTAERRHWEPLLRVGG
jgi:transposase